MDLSKAFHTIKDKLLLAKLGVPADIFLLKVKNRNTRTSFEICSELTIKTPERRNWRHSGVFIINFEKISHFASMYFLLTLSM